MTSDPPEPWVATAPPAPDCPPLSGAAQADVAVVGAGYTGLSAALHLARAGVSVALVEAACIGAGASGRNVGLVNAGLWLSPEDLIARAGPDRGERLLDLLARAPGMVWDLVAAEGLACEARAIGTLHCAPDARGTVALAARARQWAARGAALDLLDAQATQARLGSPAYRAALFDPRAGTIQPLAYARELARAGQRAGARIFCQSPVRSIAQRKDGWRLRLQDATLDAGQVILATNAYSTPPFAEIGRAQAILPYFNFATEPLPRGLLDSVIPGEEGAWDTRKILTSFRRDARGRVILGSVGQLGGIEAGLHRAWAQAQLARIFPQLAGTPLARGGWGRIGTTPDALPRLVAHGPGMWSVSGYNGRGIAPGTVFGMLLAELVRGACSAQDIPLAHIRLAPDHLRGVKALVYRYGAALWHLAR